MSGDLPRGSPPKKNRPNSEESKAPLPPSASAQLPGGQLRTSEVIDPRDVELLTNQLAEKALEKIGKWVRWPLLLAAALATYTGFNLWNDATKRIETFQKAADEKLGQIDKNANEKLGQIDKNVNERLKTELQNTLDARKADITELLSLLRKESASALVEAERARASSIESSKEIQSFSKDAIAKVKSQAETTIAELEARLREVNTRGQSVLLSMAVLETKFNKTSEQDLQHIKDDPHQPLEALLGQGALKLINVPLAIQESGKAKPVKVAVLATGIEKFKPKPKRRGAGGPPRRGQVFCSRRGR